MKTKKSTKQRKKNENSRPQKRGRKTKTEAQDPYLLGALYKTKMVKEQGKLK
jgi:hypothetical protein